jgi:CXXC-20-CXXC protein
MAKCPKCGMRQPYWKAMATFGKRGLSCANCGAVLQVNHGRMSLFYAAFNFGALLLGLAMGLTNGYRQGIPVLIFWIVVMMAIYPLVLKLKVVNAST